MNIKKIIPKSLISLYHYLLAFLSAFIYNYPSRKIKVIGVTGTKGKSTVVDLTSRILEEAGYNVCSISSIGFKIKDKIWQNRLKMAMPGRFKIQRFLNKSLKERCHYAVLEVSSEGIKQHRARFIDFKAAVFTNLSPEHIEAHGGFENYRKAKLELFKNTKDIHIINLNDENAKWFLEVPAREKWGYGLKIPNSKHQIPNKFQIPNSKSKTIFAENFYLSENGIKFFVNNTEFVLKLLGEFNIYNALAAISAGLSQGISLEVSKKALEKVKGIDGRMEVVFDKGFKVVVDYAHTPDSLEKVYQVFKDRSLICVLGSCGGGRDKWKRPVLGEIADKYCKEIIITNEDPYDENPSQILSEIKSGISNFQFPISNFYEILDRRQAIRKAIELARPGDIVIITGKGSEPWMCVANGKKIPWDDREIAREEINKKALSN